MNGALTDRWSPLLGRCRERGGGKSSGHWPYGHRPPHPTRWLAAALSGRAPLQNHREAARLLFYHPASHARREGLPRAPNAQALGLSSASWAMPASPAETALPNARQSAEGRTSHGGPETRGIDFGRIYARQPSGCAVA